jgi:hypothetical protein
VRPAVERHWQEIGWRPERDDGELLERWEWVGHGGRKAIRTVPVRFNAYKGEGKDYLQRLFLRAAEGERVQVIAISPRCVVLLRQLRGLELVDDGSGRIKKGDDHGPDSLIAGAAPIAVAHRGAVVEERDLSSAAA